MCLHAILVSVENCLGTLKAENQLLKILSESLDKKLPEISESSQVPLSVTDQSRQRMRFHEQVLKTLFEVVEALQKCESDTRDKLQQENIFKRSSSEKLRPLREGCFLVLYTMPDIIQTLTSVYKAATAYRITLTNDHLTQIGKVELNNAVNEISSLRNNLKLHLTSYRDMNKRK